MKHQRLRCCSQLKSFQALEEQDILFRQVTYTDQDHSLSSYHKHLYHTLTDFLLNDCTRERRAK